MVRRAPELDHRGLSLLTCNVLTNFANQPGLSQSGVTDEQDHLAKSLLRLLPAVAEHAQFGVTPDQWRQISGVDQRDPVDCSDVAHDGKQVHWLWHTTNSLRGVATRTQRIRWPGHA